ncbi:hypothetical protein CONPUDRAFT_152381 [Coniophora puteana RWD-64-598 SS2]|uniref:Uncharacterized protein n=1 Tax=Coniophora puteana (strain RWD-64-598) TaxID=741705 RepID=A0A5M3MXJ7_CONPW|nr:uncharacterized protein CONPUDRAFT_152381 [Coniophora puteana RWD-64-598 SS2]EIW83351.1 hypothetical protein CONPUDRAFT_152381 [Coniophora puteana RWD-64-598 SS2]
MSSSSRRPRHSLRNLPLARLSQSQLKKAAKHARTERRKAERTSSKGLASGASGTDSPRPLTPATGIDSEAEPASAPGSVAGSRIPSGAGIKTRVVREQGPASDADIELTTSGVTSGAEDVEVKVVEPVKTAAPIAALPSAPTPVPTQLTPKMNGSTPAKDEKKIAEAAEVAPRKEKEAPTQANSEKPQQLPPVEKSA